MMREWSSEPPLSWPRLNCSRPSTSAPASRESQYKAALPMPPQPTTMYSNAFFPIPFMPASCPGSSVGLPSGLAAALRGLLLLHTVQLVAGLGYARPRTPLAFVGGYLAEGPCHLPDVGRDRAAAGAYVVVAEVAGPQCELAHRGSREGYLLQLVRELGERDEVGSLVCPVERDGLGRHVDRIGDGSAHLLHDWEHVLRRAQAVGAYNVNACVGQTLYLFARRIALEGVGIVVKAHGHHRGEPFGLDGFGGDHGLTEPVERLRDDEVHALLGHHVELAVEELAGAAVGIGIFGPVDPGATQVAGDEHF